MSEWDDDEWDACEMMDFSEDDEFSEPSKKKKKSKDKHRDRDSR